MFCQDKSLTLLAKYGYNVVRLPRTGIAPLDVLGRDGAKIERLGRLPVIWNSQGQVPTISMGDIAAEIKTVTTATLKTSLGLRILEDILSGLGAAVPRLEFAYGKKRSLQFAFDNIRIDKVEPFDVGQYLKQGDLQTGDPWVGRYFFDDGTDAYIITEILTSDSVSVLASSEDSSDVGVDVPRIQAVIGADLKVEVGASRKSEVTYKGQRHLTFGFKAFQIGYDYNDQGAGEWCVRGVDPSKGDVYLDATQKESQPLLLAEQRGRVARVDLR